ncbi:ABC transporter permease [Oceanobacillus sojae]|uniref:ABC transporter permease n=1 Tax=Oceanobacillus sojae TaxID=582851 RepID=UPI00098859F9|nr:ABC transporter permease [Oceanobacillus sojae]
MSNSTSENVLSRGFLIVHRQIFLRWIPFLIGFPIHIIALCIYFSKRKSNTYDALFKEKMHNFMKSKAYAALKSDYEKQYDKKQAYFQRSIKEAEKEKFVQRQLRKRSKAMVEDELGLEARRPMNYMEFFHGLLLDKRFIILTFIPGILAYSMYFIYQGAFRRFVFERVVMTFFVIISVIVIVFTILYISPSDAAANILGESATQAQRDAFNIQYGLDQSYFVQLWNALSGILTFDLGHSYTGNEVIMNSISNRFPVTLILAISSLILAVIIAVPVGMISAARVNSFWDYTFMFIALIGLSIPSFWQGLIFILTFSIQGDLLPSSYSPGNMLSLIMPVVVLGTGLAAAIARMTRSSMLEVMNEDYMITAKAKGLNGRETFTGHALRNAWIPILTVIGLQFGGMLGGAAVTEKVFNISGLGSYIVDKQFIPDTPAILAGVVYIAITISIVNLIVDLVYAMLNPRIRSQMKNS